jgi:hypothetical protein
MKQALLTSVLMLLPLLAWSKDGDTFTAPSREGIDVLYQIISETDKTVRVGKEAVYISDPAYTPAVAEDAKGTLTIPNMVNGYYVVELGFGSFYHRAGITELVLPHGLEKIYYPFTYTSGLRRFNLPSTLTSFNAQFGGCFNIESIELPLCVTKIEWDMFASSGFKRVIIPSSVTEIQKEAFLYNRTLQALFLKTTNLPSIDATAFPDYCYENTIVYVSASVLKRLDNFPDWKKFKNVRGYRPAGDVFKWTDKAGVEFEFKVLSATDFTVQLGSGDGPAIDPSHKGNINIPTYADGYEVVGIADNAFTECTGITAVTANFDHPMAYPASAFPIPLLSKGYLYVPEEFLSRYTSKSGWASFRNVNPPEYQNGKKYFITKTQEGIDMTFFEGDALRKYAYVTTAMSSGSEYSPTEYVISQDTEGPVTIPDYPLGFMVTQIGNHAFLECKKITSVKIPDTVTEIGQDAFLSCTSLESVNVPVSLKVIKDGAFYYCRNLTGTIVLPEGFTTLGDEAFAYCSKLSGVVIPSTLTVMGSGVFSGCKGLTSLSVGAGNATYDSRDNCNALINTATNTLVLGTANTVIPKTVTAIGSSAFAGIESLQSIEIPASVTSIGTKAYSNCSGVRQVIIHGSPTIASAAFGGIKELETVTVEATRAYDIADDAFSAEAYANAILYVDPSLVSAFAAANGWKNFKHVNTSETPLEAGDTFTAATIEGVEVTYSVIDPKAKTVMVGTESIKADIDETTEGTITIPAKVNGYKVIGICSHAFYACRSLNTVVLPSTITQVGSNSFGFCSALTSVNLPEGLTTIADKAFYKCTALPSIHIPASVTTIGADAFLETHDLTAITVAAGNTVYDSRDNCNAIIETATNTLLKGCNNSVVPDGIITIGPFAFSSIYSGEYSLVLPSSVTTIGRRAFYFSFRLKSIVIPASVTSIGNDAFYSCSNMTSLTVLSPTPVAVSEKTFYKCNNAVLYVPEGCKAAYEAADYWKDFKQIKDGTETPEDIVPTEPIDLTGVTSFTAPTIEGVEVTYTVIDAEARTVKVGTADNAIAIDGNTIGTVTIPSEVRGCKVVEIGTKAFYWAWKVTDFVIPNSVKVIADHAFDCCRALTSITIPSGVYTIGSNAFAGCVCLTSASIPASVIHFGSFAFSGCSVLTSVTVGHRSPLGITQWDFDNHENATLYVPEGSKAAYEAAENWKDFKEIVEYAVSPEDPDAQYDWRFIAKTVEGVDVTYTVTDWDAKTVMVGIEDYNANIDVNTTGKVTIPSEVNGYSVVQIAKFALASCRKLTAIELPGTITAIGYGSFLYCSNLKYLRVRFETPLPVEEYTFKDCYEATLYVPVGCKAAYEAADYWKEFKEIKEIGDDENIADDITATDIVEVINFITGNPSGTFDEKAADMNGDQQINIADIIQIINNILTAQ